MGVKKYFTPYIHKQHLIYILFQFNIMIYYIYYIILTMINIIKLIIYILQFLNLTINLQY